MNVVTSSLSFVLLIKWNSINYVIEIRSKYDKLMQLI
jgi:hypothetical protein